MTKFRLYILFVLCITLAGCVRKELHDIPTAEFTVSWENSRTQQHSDAVFYLFPEFDYQADPLEIYVQNGKSQKLSLMPGKYKVLMHNAPCDPVQIVDKQAYSTLGLYANYDGSQSLDFSQIMTLGASDPAHEIFINLDVHNQFTFKPISASKNIRFIIHGDEKFGLIDLVDAYLDGVASKLNLATMKTEELTKVMIPNWNVKDKTFTSAPVEVLSFADGNEKVILTLVVTSPESEYPKEQPVDLTDEIRDMQGDEIEITMKVEYNPDIRIRKVSIKEWLAGNELNIPIN